MKLPKTLNIAGKKYKTKFTTGCGGCFYGGDTIQIGREIPKATLESK